MMHALSQDERNFAGSFVDRRDTRHLSQYNHHPSQTMNQNVVSFGSPSISHGCLMEIPGEVDSTSPTDSVSIGQIYSRAIPEALKQSGVISIGYYDGDNSHASLPLGYPIWHHPRIGHFSPAQRDPEFGFYVPIEPPTSSVSSFVPSPVDIVFNPMPSPKHLVPQNMQTNKHPSCRRDNDWHSKRLQTAKSKKVHGHSSSRRDELSVKEMSPELKVKKNASNIVKSCVCRSAHAHAPRPSNPFVLYKSHHTKYFTKLAHAAKIRGDSENSTPAKQASTAWKTEAEEVKNKFRALADREKELHVWKYPNYRYEPNKKQANKFGDHTCRCGAYQTNCAALRSRDGSGFRGHPPTGMPSDTHGNDEYLMRMTTPPWELHQRTPFTVSSIQDFDPLLLYPENNNDLQGWDSKTQHIPQHEVAYIPNTWSSSSDV